MPLDQLIQPSQPTKHIPFPALDRGFLPSLEWNQSGITIRALCFYISQKTAETRVSCVFFFHHHLSCPYAITQTKWIGSCNFASKSCNRVSISPSLFNQTRSWGNKGYHRILVSLDNQRRAGFSRRTLCWVSTLKL